MGSGHLKICHFRNKYRRYLSAIKILILVFCFYDQVSYSQDKISHPLMEAHLFDATDDRYQHSMFGRSLFEVTTKFSQMDIFTVVDLKATQIEMAAAMQSKNTVALYFGGHGSPKGVLVDGQGYGVAFDTFIKSPSSSVRLVECAGCHGEISERNYPVPAGVKFLHGKGLRAGYELLEDFDAFPNLVAKELQKESGGSIASATVTDPYGRIYPNGDIYVIEHMPVAQTVAKSVENDSLINEKLYWALITKASLAGYRVLFYRGEKYESATKYASAQKRAAGFLLNGPAIAHNPRVPEIHFRPASSVDVPKKVLSRKDYSSIDDFEAAIISADLDNRESKEKGFTNLIDTFMSAVGSNKDGSTNQCTKLLAMP